MGYPALPDRRMNYDDDGTVVAYRGGTGAGSFAIFFGLGFSGYVSNTDQVHLNNDDYASLVTGISCDGAGGTPRGGFWFFFPEQREVSALYAGYSPVNFAPDATNGVEALEGSNDTTNGVDGTWELATFPGGIGQGSHSLDGWRSGIKAVSFTGPKRVVRICFENSRSGDPTYPVLIHLYGQKAAGQTPDDILYLNGNASFAEFASPADFGDRPLATTQTWTWQVKNGSATHTANSINLQCNDTDFTISTDGVTWVTTINVASLAAGASSATMYIRDTSPAVGSLLGPRYARIIGTVGSYT